MSLSSRLCHFINFLTNKKRKKRKQSKGWRWHPDKVFELKIFALDCGNEHFKSLFRKQIYRPVFNWRGIENLLDIEAGKIKRVVYGDESFTDEEDAKFYNFFTIMAQDSINMPNFTA